MRYRASFEAQAYGKRWSEILKRRNHKEDLEADVMITLRTYFKEVLCEIDSAGSDFSKGLSLCKNGRQCINQLSMLSVLLSARCYPFTAAV